MAGQPVAASFRCGLRWFSGRRWCSGRRRARPPARSPHASFARSGRSRSPPVPSGPSGALHTGGTWCADVWLCFVLKPGQAPPPPTGTAAWSSIPPAPSTPAAPGALTCRAAGCACGFSVPPHAGGDGGFAPCEAFLPRVADVSEAWMAYFPPIGGGEVAVRGGVAAKVQTHWAKNAENRLFWLNGSALWRICCLSWCVVRTRTRYCEPKPAMSHLNPLFRAWTGLPRLVLAG